MFIPADERGNPLTESGLAIRLTLQKATVVTAGEKSGEARHRSDIGNWTVTATTKSASHFVLRNA
jgi:hypothetical protein